MEQREAIAALRRLKDVGQDVMPAIEAGDEQRLRELSSEYAAAFGELESVVGCWITHDEPQHTEGELSSLFVVIGLCGIAWTLLLWSGCFVVT